jgi:branched-chain amino acid transport system substrate-binding protein
MKRSRLATLLALTGVLGAVAASAASAGPNVAAAASCTSPTIGFAAPITGPAAALGAQQRNWFQFALNRWNLAHSTKLNYVEGDTQLPKTSEATKVAQRFASNSEILAVIGPAGSQENVATTSIFKRAKLAFISGSATRTSLTDGSRKGYFFRVVPNDDAQGPVVANAVLSKVGVKSGDTVAIVDDQESYGLGLSDFVQKALEAKGVKVQRESVNPDPTTSPDFSSLAARISSDAKAVYVPWQLAQAAQTFGQQLKEQGKNVPMFGSDGLFSPTEFKISGSYLSFWGVVTNTSVLNSFKKIHGGAQFFGAPQLNAVEVVGRAIEQACKDGKVTRDEVRTAIAKTNLGTSFAGIPIRFTPNGDLTVQKFFIYKVVGGNYIQQK